MHYTMHYIKFACILHLYASRHSSVACIVKRITVHPPSSQHCASKLHSYSISTGSIFVHAANEHKNEIRLYSHESCKVSRLADAERCWTDARGCRRMLKDVKWCWADPGLAMGLPPEGNPQQLYGRHIDTHPITSAHILMHAVTSYHILSHLRTS